MFSDGRYLLPVIIAADLVLAGCGLGGDKTAPAPVVISTGKYSCLAQAAKKADEFVHDRMSDAQVNQYVDCLQSTLQVFIDRFHGHEDRDSFSANEVRTFLQDNFLPDGQLITDELLHQFMIIKQDLIGGNLDRVTRADLQGAIAKLNVVRDEALRLRPHVRILNPELADGETVHVPEKIKAAETAMNQAVANLGALLEASHRPYAFDDLRKFLVEFQAFSHWKEQFHDNREPLQWVRLLATFKTATVSPGENEMAPADWKPFLRSAGSWYLDYIKYRIGIRNQPIMVGEGFQNFVGFGTDIRERLNEAIAAQPDHVVHFHTTRALMTALKDVNWLPDYLRVESAEKGLEAAVVQILNGGAPVDGINSDSVNNMWSQFSQWREIQAILQKTYNASDRPAHTIGLFSWLVTTSKSNSPHENWKDFLQIFQDDRPFYEKRPLFKQDLDRVFLIEAKRLKNFNVTDGFYNLSKINLYRSILEAVFKGYADSEKDVPKNWRISQGRVEKFYCDFRDLGIDIGLVDPRNMNAASRTFMETKMFTYLSDGMPTGSDKVLSFAQGIQEGAFLYSGGKTADDIYDAMAEYCPKGKEDIHHQLKLDRRCVRDHLIDELKKHIHTMPAYTGVEASDGVPAVQGFLDRLSADQRREYSEILLATAFNKFSAEDPDYVELSELQTVGMVVHYAEAVFTRFNEDMDDYLSESEVNNALPVFTGLVYEMGSKLGYTVPGDGFAAHAFKFILATGRMPSGAADQARIAGHWVLHPYGQGESWDLQLDRMQIGRVFRAIISKMIEANATIKSPCVPAS